MAPVVTPVLVPMKWALDLAPWSAPEVELSRDPRADSGSHGNDSCLLDVRLGSLSN